MPTINQKCSKRDEFESVKTVVYIPLAYYV
jgi:hypothetical protein